jgi:chromosome segregation protein
MYLKKIELHGFKSFADQSIIEFMPGITGIVGPNGCGKSNISDAVRWVLGEQSVKSLRGSSMSDVIFTGSEDRKAQSLAEVTLVFDNEDRSMNIAYNEVSITRRLYRHNNEAEYLINNEPCRLKDIVDLVMDTGMGRDSLSMISQGNISSFADSKPEERRGMFEEAAGVSKYKKRKIESIRKLERTKENLDRVEDICNELERQLIPLKKQKEKAEIYIELKKELKDIEVSVLVKEIESLSLSLKELNQSLDELDKEKTSNDAAILLNEAQSEQLTKRMYALDEEVNNMQTKLLTAMNNLQTLQARKIEIDANRKHLLQSSSQENLKEKIKQLKLVLQESIHEYNDRVNRYNETKKEKNELEEKQTIHQQQINKLREEIERIQLDLHSSMNKKEQLIDIVENKSNYSVGVRAIIQAKNSLDGIVGVLGELLTTQSQYEQALSVALSLSRQNIVVKNEDNAKAAISFLKNNKAGRATFLPITNMKARKVRAEHLLVCENFPGFIGVFSQFVNSKYDLGEIIENQLGNVLLVETIDDATKLSKALYSSYRIVTLDGDVVNVGGSLTGGRHKINDNSYFSKRELEKVKKYIKSLEKSLNQKKKELNELENELREISQFILQKNVTYAKLEMEVRSKHGDVQLNKSEYETLTHQSIENDQLLDESSNHQFIDELNKAQKLKDDLTENIQAKRTLRMSFVNENERIENELREQRKISRNINDEITLKKVEKATQDSKINNYLMRLNDEYKMTYEYAKSEYNEDIQLMKAHEEVNLLKHRIESLGHVNVQSIEDYENVSHRYDNLNTQRLDLISAQDSLLKAIDEMDEIMVKRFSETFAKINVEFNHVFRNLFGGGRAELKYTDPDNILETGIDIDVQPPGKTIQNISLFSGGEKALIAISCLFAILRVRPVPMCILDEVEAALDIANVERFAKYLREFSESTQFIVITHRQGTMEECDLLYGATMQQKGVTKLVSVKLKDAIVLANE